jgi:hypothetical protein
MPLYWIKVGEGQPTKVECNGCDVDDLKNQIKLKLAPKFDAVAVDDIVVRTPNREVLQPSYVIVGRQSSDGIHFLVDPPHTQGKKKR